MSKASSGKRREVSSVEELSSDVAVKVQRRVHAFRWYTETRWFTRHESGGVLYLEPEVRGGEEAWRARVYPLSRVDELREYFERGDVSVRPRSHLPEYSDPIRG